MMDRLRVLAELLRFVAEQRAWWLAPLVLGLVLISVIALLGSATPLAPFVYPLF